MAFPVEQLSQIAGILDENQIRHVLGFDMNTTLWNVPLALDEAQFIIHDEHFLAAVDLITNAGYRPCTNQDCRIVQATNGIQIPEAHFHFSFWGHFTLSVYKKSNIYWALPDFPIEHPDSEDHHFMLSNDPRLPSSFWEDGLCPAKILTPVALTETLLLLACRDVYHPNNLSPSWIRYILFAMQHARKYWVKTDDLQPQFRPYWQLFRTEPAPGQHVGIELQEELAKLRRKVLDEGSNMPPPQDTRMQTNPCIIEIEEKYGPGASSKYWP